MALASGRWALPLKTTISRTDALPVSGVSSLDDCFLARARVTSGGGVRHGPSGPWSAAGQLPRRRPRVEPAAAEPLGLLHHHRCRPPCTGTASVAEADE